MFDFYIDHHSQVMCFIVSAFLVRKMSFKADKSVILVSYSVYWLMVSYNE